MGPKIAQPAPDFSGIAVINNEFKEIQLSDYKGKYLVLFFYPLDFTFVCPTEIIAFSEAAKRFKVRSPETPRAAAANDQGNFYEMSLLPRRPGHWNSF